MTRPEPSSPPEVAVALSRFTAEEWLLAGMNELKQAEQALAHRNGRAAIVGLKRAAGMALNGVLRVAPNPGWGRSYLDHLRAMAVEAGAPPAVRAAAEELCAATVPGPGLPVALRTPRGDDRLVEAARTVMAHAYAVVHGTGPAAASGGEDQGRELE